MIRDYLIHITSIELVDVDDPLEDMSAYDTAIDSMAAHARADVNLNKLHLALESLIAEPGERIQQFYGTGYPFSQGELVAILTYACHRIWPGDPVIVPGEALPVEFVTEAEP